MDWLQSVPDEPPRKGDQLFTGSGDEGWQMNAQIHSHRDSGYGYVRGYRIAAQAMTQRLIDEKGWETNFLVYPVAFLYRHHLELMLKRLIVVGTFLEDKALTPAECNQTKKTHRLDLLWNILRPLIKSQCPPADDDIKGVSHYINELNKVDPESQSFRYALSTKDEPALSSIPYMNMAIFAAAMERLCNFFDFIDVQFDLHTDNKNEMLAYKADCEAEMRAEYEAEMRAEQYEHEAEMRAEYEAEMRAEQYEHEAEMRADYEAEMRSYEPHYDEGC